VIEADEYLFTLGGAVAEVAVLNEPLCYYRLHGHNLYQFGDYDPTRLRRKHSVVAELADTLPNRPRALGVSDANAYKVVENTTLGDPRWPVKALILLLALTLPPKVFYRLRRRYSMLRKTVVPFSPITAWRAGPTS
jgi:hypothetical protein